MVFKEYKKVYGVDPVDKDLVSLFPGNINGLILSLNEYCDVLEKTEGLVPEFINPKYKDA